jgi:DNA modification methylase
MTDRRTQVGNKKRTSRAPTRLRSTPEPQRLAQPATWNLTSWRVARGDCRELLAKLPRESVDAVVTDPPYGIRFQGERWDGVEIRRSVAQRDLKRTSAEAFQAWSLGWASECLRVMRPGAQLVAFGAPRIAHRLACALEEAGLELRDSLMWLYGSGMPKSRRLAGRRRHRSLPTSRSCSPASDPTCRSSETSNVTARAL